MDCVRAVFRRVGIKIPQYNTEERNLDFWNERKHPPVTGYRILVTATSVVFGVIKAALSYCGQDTAPTTVEWVYGTVITVLIYWLGLYEASANEVMPWLFTTDYSSQVAAVVFVIVKLAVLALAGGLWSYFAYLTLASLIRSAWVAPPHVRGPLASTSSSFDVLVFLRRVLALVGSLAIGLVGLGGGIYFACLIMNSLNKRIASWIFNVRKALSVLVYASFCILAHAFVLLSVTFWTGSFACNAFCSPAHVPYRYP
ncbi:hypothetical protein EST38_g10044 [Candolleomyces aberdarensis]|uniref:Uncharacterized protein n=1 Tax=Candolleomyces aberdarensis TaxID=2316362 RepID=A0A4Q2D935_9AGAR|nr:hypothetical protein EST38_g10044 [Candolleomyces aberdarensis]